MKKENIIQIAIIIALILILCVLIALYFNSGANSQGNMKENGSSSQMGVPGQGGSGGPGGQNGGDNSESVEKTGATELIKEIVKPYVELAEIQNKKLKLELEYNKKIQINQNKINELFVILLDNSLKYTNEGDTITIRTYAKDGKCNIEVQDTGIGISKEGIKHIFERFYREDKARSRQTGGNGLGLAIAQNIVTLHKGTIKAEHNYPKGTVIKIKI